MRSQLEYQYVIKKLLNLSNVTVFKKEIKNTDENILSPCTCVEKLKQKQFEIFLNYYNIKLTHVSADHFVVTVTHKFGRKDYLTYIIYIIIIS